MREQWGSRLGFVLAAVGSAVGLGNMWRFPYLTAEHGGAAFLLLYIGMTLVFGMPVLLAELVVGRGAGKSPLLALVQLGGRAWGMLGIFYVMVGFLILAYYNVIAGWTARYAWQALLGFPADLSAFFGGVSQGTSAALWHFGFMIATATVVMAGVRRGIERAVTILMPLLFLMLIGLAGFAFLQDGAERGYDFYLAADFSKLLSLDVLTAAMGQAFFSLSIGMGSIVAYASYLSKNENLPRETVLIALTDFGVAFLAGLAIFPLLFSLALQDQISESTVGALFIALPGAFEAMGAAGRILGPLFFLGLSVAALTSTISMLEVVVSSAIDRLSWSRRRAGVICSVLVALGGVPAALSTEVLGQLDEFVGNTCLPLGGLLLALFVGWRMRNPGKEAALSARGGTWVGAWLFLLRVPVPLGLAFILGRQVLRLAS